jgi:hypothetical protein
VEFSLVGFLLADPREMSSAQSKRATNPLILNLKKKSLKVFKAKHHQQKSPAVAGL